MSDETKYGTPGVGSKGSSEDPRNPPASSPDVEAIAQRDRDEHDESGEPRRYIGYFDVMMQATRDRHTLLALLQEAGRERDHWQANHDHVVTTKRVKDDMITTLRAEKAVLLAALRDAVDLAIWMSGAADFGPDGKAYEGWMAMKPKLDTARALLAQYEKEAT